MIAVQSPLESSSNLSRLGTGAQQAIVSRKSRINLWGRANRAEHDGGFVSVEQGAICQHDMREAARFCGLSARAGHSLGQYKYGFCLEKGGGVMPNPKEAVNI
jgi:TPR repeat protein